MTYQEARDFINQSNQYGWVPGLETITELLKRLGNPQEQLRVIHVAGTNGKGSTCAFLTSILSQAGYRVGRYISPTLYSYRERIQIILPEQMNRQEDNSLNDQSLTVNSGILLRKNTTQREHPYEQGIEYITKDGVIRTIERIKPICEGMVREGFAHPTTFEIETAMTFLYFLWERVDLVVLEVGLGGRLDATNVIRASICSVITSISMDHMQYLGDTLEQIAAHKAGIIKSGCPVVTCDQEPEVLQVIRNRAGETASDLYIADSKLAEKLHYSLEGTKFSYRTSNQCRMNRSSYNHFSLIDTNPYGVDHNNISHNDSNTNGSNLNDNSHNINNSNDNSLRNNNPEGSQASEFRISLLGKHQVKNAILALVAARVIRQAGYPISEEAIQAGLSTARWSGRLELISTRPYLIIDGAHNEEAASTLREAIELYFQGRRILYLMGVLADKEYEKILKITAPLAALILTLTPENARALRSDLLAEKARNYCDRVIDAGTVTQALHLAFEEAGEEDVIIAFGSLSFLGDLVNAFNSKTLLQ